MFHDRISFEIDYYLKGLVLKLIMERKEEHKMYNIQLC